MLLNLDMITERFPDIITKQSLRGHASLLSLAKWQMYDGETELSPNILYLADAKAVRPGLTGPDESALLLLGDPDPVSGRLKVPHAIADPEKTGMIQLINLTAAAFAYFDDINMQLSETLFEGGNFQQLVDIFSPVMSNELILMNSEFKLVGHTYKNIRLYQMNSFIQDLGEEYIPSEVLTFFKNDPIYAKVRDETEPFLYQASVHNVDIWCMNVFSNNRFLCRVTMPESEHPFRPYDKELLRFFTGIVQKKYDHLQADDSYQENSRLTGLFLKLLEGKYVEENLLGNALRDFLPGADRLYRCIHIVPSDRDYYNMTLTAYCHYIETHFKGTAAFEYLKHIVCVITVPGNADRAGEHFREFTEFLRDNFLKAGFSNRFADVRELALYYKQAKAALETGMTHSPHKWFFYFQEECLSYMRRLVTSELPPEYVCHPKLLEIMQHDETHGTDYMNTLVAYIDSGRNAAETAKKLFLHRSTMMYRLKRLREGFEIDFDDPDERLYLMFSIRLLQEKQERTASSSH